MRGVACINFREMRVVMPAKKDTGLRGVAEEIAGIRFAEPAFTASRFIALLFPPATKQDGEMFRRNLTPGIAI